MLRSIKLIAGLGVIGSVFFPCNLAFALDLREPGGDSAVKSVHNSSLGTPVVQILTSGSSGSAVVVGERPDAYIALTAHHVVGRSSVGELIVRLADGSQAKVISVTRPLPSVDLAVLSFQKTKRVPIAILPFLDKELWQKVNEWPLVYVIGYSVPTPDAPNVILRSDSGKIESILNQSQDGYNFLYSSKTLVGMSGGGIFGEADVAPRIKDAFADTKQYYYDSYGSAGNQYDLFTEYVQGEKAWDPAKANPAQNAFYSKCVSDPSWRPDYETGEKAITSSREWWEQMTSGKSRSHFCALSASSPFGTNYKNCLLVANVQWSGTVTSERAKDPNSFLLLAIHGRAERSDSDNPSRTGSALGIYLGTPAIRSFLEKNQTNFGLRPAFSYARQVCSAKET